MREKLTLYYDKACPFCNRYAHYLTLQNIYGLQLKDARESLQEIRAKCPGLDINEGVILIAGDQCLQGVEALAYLDKLLERPSLFTVLHRVWTLPAWLTQPLYSSIKKMRQLLLWLMNKKSDIR